MAEQVLVDSLPPSVVELPSGTVSVEGITLEYAEVATTLAIVELLASTVVVEEPSIAYVEVGIQGSPSRQGSPVWITDVTPTSAGIVGQKTYRPFVASTPLIGTAVADNHAVRVHVAGTGSLTSYSPIITVNGVAATIVETPTTQWFTGYVDITLVDGVNIITADNGADTDTMTVTVSTGGPSITSIVFGAYPGVQTALKQDDVLACTIRTDLSATSVAIQVGGAAKYLVSLPVTLGVATGNITISGSSGSQTVSAVAHNSLGTPGMAFVSPALTLDQVYPSFVQNSITYGSGNPAANIGEIVTLDVTVSNYDTVAYASVQVTVPNPALYAQSKACTVTLSGYNTANNYSITAHKVANDSTANFSTAVNIASVPPTAVINISGSPTRLVSSPTGISYTVTITPSQVLAAAPTLLASIGLWQGVWVQAGDNWQRQLLIADGDVRGTGVFSSLSMQNQALIAGSTIASGGTYVVGGFTSRALTFAAFSRVTAIGATVEDQTKTTAQIVGGAVLTLHTDNGAYSTGYYIANSDGTYNPTGGYLALSDSAFAGANTSGTLQASIQEVA